MLTYSDSCPCDWFDLDVPRQGEKRSQLHERCLLCFHISSLSDGGLSTTIISRTYRIEWSVSNWDLHILRSTPTLILNAVES
ncbi:hypothetical protein KC19_11G105000 [Ceratodon purpureus]|uniref:Uncharacterized protein n=1 Tax=Ceratodon purpureus TaxID=3225 RepID=A0A8T0GEM3_CERPU|nr:hypothetical protein KC19_11G105000 [Ceratodon purpureus]